MRPLLTALLLCLFISAWTQQDASILLKELNRAIDDAPVIDVKKQTAITAIKQQLRDSRDPLLRYNTCLQLYEEYKTFKYDSAYHYATTLRGLAAVLDDQVRIGQAKLKIGFSLVSAGLFKEAADSLNLIPVIQLPDSLKMEYYQVMGRFYYDLADFGNDSYHSPGYVRKGNAYLDSALRFFTPGSFPDRYFRGLKDIRSGDNLSALAGYRQLMEDPSLTHHEIALTASTLSDIYIQKGENDTAIILLIKAAVADIYSSTKETAAAFNLANLLYKKG
ncbi:MAG: tetratricopeptide repeat protein, partial [Chitinophagaceae bacterium]